jgi:hypothetical protein
MTLTVKHEDITAAQAHAYLGLSAGNRTLNSDYVLSLAVAMEQGKWDESASEIVFDEDNKLIDGHHRLSAVVAFGSSVRMLVKRGVSKAARGLIDTGRTRGIRDLMTMFRPDVKYVTTRKAALFTCIGLIVPSGRPTAIRTLDAYDSWMRQFREGVDAAVEITRAGASGKMLQLGPVAGAFAFAHKINPKKVETFMVRVRDGAGLTLSEPAYTLRALLTGPRTSSSGSDRMALSRKVLQAIHADMHGKTYRKAQAGYEGLEYFRTAYDGKAIERLISLWTPGDAAVKELPYRDA